MVSTVTSMPGQFLARCKPGTGLSVTLLDRPMVDPDCHLAEGWATSLRPAIELPHSSQQKA